VIYRMWIGERYCQNRHRRAISSLRVRHSAMNRDAEFSGHWYCVSPHNKVYRIGASDRQGSGTKIRSQRKSRTNVLTHLDVCGSECILSIQMIRMPWPKRRSLHTMELTCKRRPQNRTMLWPNSPSGKESAERPVRQLRQELQATNPTLPGARQQQ
jgi:hypothetical protein